MVSDKNAYYLISFILIVLSIYGYYDSRQPKYAGGFADIISTIFLIIVFSTIFLSYIISFIILKKWHVISMIISYFFVQTILIIISRY
jgi:hypothetical protein